MLPGTQVVIRYLRLKVLQKGDPQGPRVSYCLLLEGELSKETHRLTKQKTFKKKSITLFLGVLGLCCCAQAFSSCGKQGLLFLEAQGFLISVASLIVEHGLEALWLSSCGS